MSYNKTPPKISIIIPVYNVEKYLARCIDSILLQSFKDFEVICINDGSKDNSLKILKKYKNIDNRIKVINKKNEGSGEARNRGLELARGKYISFVDSDDWLNENFLEVMYKKIINSEYDIVMCNPIIVYNKNKEILRTGKFKELDFKKNPFEIIEILNMPIIWNKLYKKEILLKHNIKFPKFLYHQDVEFLYKVLVNTKKIYKIEKGLYYYYKRIDSVTGNINRKNIMDNFKILNNIEKYIKIENKNNDIFILFKIIYLFGVYLENEKNKDIKMKKIIDVSVKDNLKRIKILKIIRYKKIFILYLALKYSKVSILNKLINIMKTKK